MPDDVIDHDLYVNDVKAARRRAVFDVMDLENELEADEASHQ